MNKLSTFSIQTDGGREKSFIFQVCNELPFSVACAQVRLTDVSDVIVCTHLRLLFMGDVWQGVCAVHNGVLCPALATANDSQMRTLCCAMYAINGP